MPAIIAWPTVVDTSVVVKWLLPEPDSPNALAQRCQWNEQGVVPVVPDFLLLDLHNALWKKLEHGELTLDAPVLSYAPTFGLDLQWFPFEPLLPLAWAMACRHHISVYDAVYAALRSNSRPPAPPLTRNWLDVCTRR